MNLYRRILRPLLFRLDAERAHELTLAIGTAGSKLPGVSRLARTLTYFEDPRLEVSAAGLRFRNPIGLAAGFDKSGLAIKALSSIGLGSVEIGSISALPSLGNPKPRLLRLPHDQAIAVNYGLPNEGSKQIEQRLSIRSRDGESNSLLGINLVPTNTFGECLSTTDSINDLKTSCGRLHPHADYLNINLSCPNAPQDEEGFRSTAAIKQLLAEIEELAPNCPVFLKIEPTLDEEYLHGLVSCVKESPSVRGFQFNLEPGRPEHLELSSAAKHSSVHGAISGRPTAAYNCRCIETLYSIVGNDYEIIASGGIFSARDAYERIRLGASLLQIYTSLVYEGPSLIKKLKRGLIEHLNQDGLANISDARGLGL